MCLSRPSFVLRIFRLPSPLRAHRKGPSAIGGFTSQARFVGVVWRYIQRSARKHTSISATRVDASGHDQDSPRCRRVLLICPEWITLVPEHLSSLPWPGCSILFLNVFPFETSEVEHVTRQHHLVERAPAWDPRHPRAPPFPYGLVFSAIK